jgi:glutathione peroxidase
LANINYPGFRYLYDKYHDAGFDLVGFPCNQFGGQAPGTSQQEREFAWKKFGFEFPIMDKIEVNGPNAHPIYKMLKEQQPLSLPGSSGPPPGGEKGRIEWNYTKFVINRQGNAAKRFKPAFDPVQFEGDIRLLLANKDVLPAECIAHPGRKVCNVDKLLA